MNPILIFIIILAAAVVFLIVLAVREAAKRGTSTAEGIVGICSVALNQTVRKNANKEKIKAFLSQKREASNAELREYLRVTDRSIVRYMDELEKEDKVEQVGNTGRGVIYRLK